MRKVESGREVRALISQVSHSVVRRILSENGHSWPNHLFITAFIHFCMLSNIVWHDIKLQFLAEEFIQESTWLDFISQNFETVEFSREERQNRPNLIPKKPHKIALNQIYQTKIFKEENEFFRAMNDFPTVSFGAFTALQRSSNASINPIDL